MQFRSSLFSSLRPNFYLKGGNAAVSNNKNQNNNDAVAAIKDGDHPVIMDNSRAQRPSPTNRMDQNTVATKPASSKKNNEDDKGKKETLFLLETTTIVDKKNNYVSMVGSFATKKSKGFNHRSMINMDSFDTGYTSSSINSTMVFKNDYAPKNTVVITGCHCQDDNNHECGETVVVIANDLTKNWSSDHDVRPL